MDTVAELIEDLEARLRRYPVERYPIQHATTQFHLGVVLTDAGRCDEAQIALAVAADAFDPVRLPAEHGKAMNALGAALRVAGRTTEAADAFVGAERAFAEAGLVAERGAALFNLGLVRRELGDVTAAIECFRDARALFEAPGRAGAAARELGTSLFAAGDLEGAGEALMAAAELADRAGDAAGLGAAANALGLVHLAAERPAAAVESLRTALACHPRSVRPAELAMVKANLAVAYEAAGDAAHARLAARQALGLPVAAQPVREQARGVLARLGDGAGDVLRVLDAEPAERWPGVLREELARWVEADPAERRVEAAAWIEGQLARDTGTDLCEQLLGTLLEMPPGAMEAVIRALLEAHGGVRFRSDLSLAAARFHGPQCARLEHAFRDLDLA